MDSDIELLTRKKLFEFLAHASSEIDCVIAVGEGRERIDLFAVEQYIQFDEVGWSETVHMPIKRGIAFRYRLEFVVEVNNDLAERHVEQQLHTVSGYIRLLDQLAAFAEAQGHDRSDIIGYRDDGCPDIRLFDAVYLRQIRHAGRVVYLYHIAVFGIDVITYIRYGGDDVHIELAVEALLDDLHMKQSEEPAAETKAQRHRTLGLESEGRIIQLQFLQRCPQVFVVLAFDRIDSREDHRLRFLKTIDRFVARTGYMCDRVTHFYLCARLDARDNVAYVTCTDTLARAHVEFEDTYLVRIVLFAGIDEPHFITRVHCAVDHLEVSDDASETIENGVEDKALQRCVGVAYRCRDALDNGIQYLRNAFACTRRATQDICAVATDEVYDLIFHPLRHRIRHVAFIDDGNDLEVVLDRHVEIGYRLRLYTLRRIHHEHRSFAGGDRTAHFV